MDPEPHQPRHDAGDPELPDHRDRPEAADDRHGALVEVGERILRLLALDAVADLLGGVLRALDRDLRDAGQVVEGDHVAHHEDLGVARQREVGVHRDPAGTVQRRAGLLRERLAERVRLHAGGPDLGDRGDALDATVLELHLETALVDVGDHGAEHDLDAELLQLVLGLLAELGTEGGQHLARCVDEHHARRAGVDGAEVLAERAVGQLGDLAGHLHPRGTRAHDDEGEEVVDLVTAGRGDLGHLERTEDPPAELERVVDALHAGGELGEVVVAEVGLARAGRDQQGVVLGDRGAPQDLGGDGARGQVDVGDLAEEHAGVVLAAEDLAGRRRDLSLGEDPRRHLVEQRLEEVVGRLADDRDVDVGTTQGLGAEQAAEPGPDHDHLVTG